ncbi:hypothetical protein PTTG_27049 [Puccinia triticina 1-1 BBBD Race 1]|uniref:Uncharacterized protein n=1 Tax=Puccinia triticina (isolate 1-1 / race 1 (BBBD)) TaxID=630390 RepID=A0A180GP43_PUCT1|nr:hypothetical protein PTTG_27049 [Puccinia triticina 1-1 BBBD Race 1]
MRESQQSDGSSGYPMLQRFPTDLDHETDEDVVLDSSPEDLLGKSLFPENDDWADANQHSEGSEEDQLSDNCASHAGSTVNHQQAIRRSLCNWSHHEYPHSPETGHDEIDELSGDDGDAEMAYSDEEDRSEDEDENVDSKTEASLEEDEWIPMSQDELDSSQAKVPAQAPTARAPAMEIDIDPQIAAMSTAELRARVKAYGLPCAALKQDRLLILCAAFAEQQRPSGTRSGQRFCDVAPTVPSSSLDAAHAALQAVEQIRLDLNTTKDSGPRRKTRRKSQVPSTIERSGLRELIRKHCAVLLGWSQKKKKFPRPATEGEKSEWGQPLISLSGHKPNPYVHEAATPQQVRIIKEIMQQAGVRRFAPNFLKPPNSPDNKLLWDLAVDTFVELMECGEYVDIDVSLQDHQIIGSELCKYVQETLARRYKKENLWPQDKQTSHTNTQKRRSRRLHHPTLVETRLGTAANIGGLECLYPVIKAATSEDETDYEEAPLKNRKRGRKHCNILAVPWRSSKITQIFVKLDDISAYQKQAGFAKPSGPQPRVRQRVKNPTSGSVQSSPNLPANVYGMRWSKQLTPKQHHSLQPGLPCDLKNTL